MAAKIVLVTLAVLAVVKGLPTGAPPEACETLVPAHGVPAQTSPAPFQAVPAASTVQAGGSLTVSLVANDPAVPFRGWLVLAQPEGANTFSGIGTFTSTTSGNIGSCLNGTENYVTHSDTTVKTTVDVTWVAPADFTGNVVFRTTFASSLVTYWVAETSTVVAVTA